MKLEFDMACCCAKMVDLLQLIYHRLQEPRMPLPEPICCPPIPLPIPIPAPDQPRLPAPILTPIPPRVPLPDPYETIIDPGKPVYEYLPYAASRPQAIDVGEIALVQVPAATMVSAAPAAADRVRLLFSITFGTLAVSFRPMATADEGFIVNQQNAPLAVDYERFGDAIYREWLVRNDAIAAGILVVNDVRRRVLTMRNPVRQQPPRRTRPATIETPEARQLRAELPHFTGSIESVQKALFRANAGQRPND